MQDELRERHRELNSIDRRIEVAEDLYRQEFGVDPPEGPAVAPRMRRETRIRRSAQGQLPWKDAVLAVLRDAGTPLHAREIWRKLQESGFESDAADPVRSVVAVVIRTPEYVKRVAPNTFALADSAESPHQQIDTETVAANGDRERSTA